eukprot:gene6056-6294_t
MAEAGSEADDLQDINGEKHDGSEAESQGGKILGAADDTSQAALLRCRWQEIFRTETSTSYDQLMWKEVALAGQLPATFDPQDQECVVMPAEVTGVLVRASGNPVKHATN